MQYVWSLVDASEKGMNCYSWLMSIADEQICYEETAAVAKRMLDAWPKERLPGFGEGVDIEWAHLYCARNGCWYNDNLITAYGKVVEGVYGNNTTILLPPMKKPVPKTPKKGMRVPPTTLSLITAASSGRIFLPLNINVDGTTQTVCCYDSTDKRANHNLLAQLADEIVKKSLTKAFCVTVVHSPIQKDGFNCGVFICLYFWRRFWKGAGSDYTEEGLLRRRWDILRTIMKFSDEIKEKEKVTE
ncbi:hypothetical protein F444_17099 [Phytophthora nicotianae P1976]|uniref:Uncharacterized protein n=1 Tax=Phytophthora nicotianae P1976 TaxID=1317066 RepID=A0A080ZGB8_PHYNI|nr:hypothetical protein F444_17099 [Phytophthora nicotianae P1976]